LRAHPMFIEQDLQFAFYKLQRERIGNLSKEAWLWLFEIWRDHDRGQQVIDAAERDARFARLCKQREELFAERALAPPQQHDSLTARLCRARACRASNPTLIILVPARPPRVGSWKGAVPLAQGRPFRCGWLWVNLGHCSDGRCTTALPQKAEVHPRSCYVARVPEANLLLRGPLFAASRQLLLDCRPLMRVFAQGYSRGRPVQNLRCPPDVFGGILRNGVCRHVQEGLSQRSAGSDPVLKAVIRIPDLKRQFEVTDRIFDIGGGFGLVGPDVRKIDIRAAKIVLHDAPRFRVLRFGKKAQR